MRCEITFDLQTHVLFLLLLFQTTRETLIKTKVKSVALCSHKFVAKNEVKLEEKQSIALTFVLKLLFLL